MAVRFVVYHTEVEFGLNSSEKHNTGYSSLNLFCRHFSCFRNHQEALLIDFLCYLRLNYRGSLDFDNDFIAVSLNLILLKIISLLH